MDGCLFRIVKFTQRSLNSLGAESFNLLETLVWDTLPINRARSRCAEHTGVNDTLLFTIIYGYEYKQFTRCYSHRKRCEKPLKNHEFCKYSIPHISSDIQTYSLFQCFNQKYLACNPTNNKPEQIEVCVF